MELEKINSSEKGELLYGSCEDAFAISLDSIIWGRFKREPFSDFFIDSVHSPICLTVVEKINTLK
jgi:hypothetical protein